MLTCAVNEERNLYNGSDVVGGISKAISFRPPSDEVYEILVISDFGQSGANIDLYRDKALGEKNHREELIAQLNSVARIPNLRGANVSACGFGAGFDRVDLLRAFWNELITDPGKGTVMEERC